MQNVCTVFYFYVFISFFLLPNLQPYGRKKKLTDNGFYVRNINYHCALVFVVGAGAAQKCFLNRSKNIYFVQTSKQHRQNVAITVEEKYKYRRSNKQIISFLSGCFVFPIDFIFQKSRPKGCTFLSLPGSSYLQKKSNLFLYKKFKQNVGKGRGGIGIGQKVSEVFLNSFNFSPPVRIKNLEEMRNALDAGVHLKRLDVRGDIYNANRDFHSIEILRFNDLIKHIFKFDGRHVNSSDGYNNCSDSIICYNNTNRYYNNSQYYCRDHSTNYKDCYSNYYNNYCNSTDNIHSKYLNSTNTDACLDRLKKFVLNHIDIYNNNNRINNKESSYINEILKITEEMIQRIHPVLKLMYERKRNNYKPNSNNKEKYKLGICIEGGGMRGCVAAGMILALHILGYSDVFDVVYGSSAGSLVGAYFISRQVPEEGGSVYTHWLPSAGRKFIDKRRIGRMLGLGFLLDMHIKDFIFDSLGEPMINLNYVLKDVLLHKQPLDWEKFWNNNRKQPLKIIASGLLSGRSVILDGENENFKTIDDLSECLRASMLLPGIAGPPVRIKNIGKNLRSYTGRIYPSNRMLRFRRNYVYNNEYSEPLADAMIFEPIPYRSALRENCTHLLILRTRPDNTKVTRLSGISAFLETLLARRYFKTKQNFHNVYEHMKEKKHRIIYMEDMLVLNAASRIKKLREENDWRELTINNDNNICINYNCNAIYNNNTNVICCDMHNRNSTSMSAVRHGYVDDDNTLNNAYTYHINNMTNCNNNNNNSSLVHIPLHNYTTENTFSSYMNNNNILRENCRTANSSKLEESSIPLYEYNYVRNAKGEKCYIYTIALPAGQKEISKMTLNEDEIFEGIFQSFFFTCKTLSSFYNDKEISILNYLHQIFDREKSEMKTEKFARKAEEENAKKTVLRDSLFPSSFDEFSISRVLQQIFDYRKDTNLY